MHKRAVIKSLMDRAEKIPTTKSDRSKEKQRVISTLQSNGYPKRFILDASKPQTTIERTQLTLQNLNGEATAQFHTLAGPLSQSRESWKIMASKWHLNPIKQ